MSCRYLNFSCNFLSNHLTPTIMKYKKTFLLTKVIFMLIVSRVLGQSASCNDFNLQLKDYRSFISKPLHIPRNLTNIKIDITNDLKYLDPNYGTSNFYLDSNNVAWGGNWFACEGGGIARRWN
jgi:hypothetical protein